MSAPESMKDVGIQAAVADRRSASEKYRDLVVGSRDFFRLVHFEFVVLFTSWVPGALGLLLRKIFYPTLLGSCGRGVVFGQGVTLRHPHKIHIGEGTVIDDSVLLDAKGVANQGIRIGERGFIGRNTILSCKDGDIVLGSHINIGFNCEVFSSSRVEVGDYGLFAAYTYVVGGGHDHSDVGAVMIDQPRPSLGVTIGRNVWLGAGAKVLDGVTTTIALTPGEGSAATIAPLGTGVTGGDINLIAGEGSTTGGTVKIKAGVGGITPGNIDFWRNITNSPALRVTDMGHLVGISGGSAEYAPTITSGGGTSPTIVGSDMAFKITLGATPGTTAIVVDFYQNYTAAPMVIAQYQSDHIALRAVATTSGITITPAAGMTQNHVIDVLVIGREDS